MVKAKETSEKPDIDGGARWRFGEAVLDERTMELLVHGQKVEVPRKPLELLMHFVRNPVEVITKDELFEAVWPGRIVSENSLSNAIARLRVALGDETEQQLIKSVYGYGYRFMGEVKRDDGHLAVPLTTEPALSFREGEPVPHRSGWLLSRRLGAGGGGEVWLAVEQATQDARVFKFARDLGALSALKREITLSRLMRESLGDRPDFVRVLDWNLNEVPYFIAIDHCSEGSLVDWAAANGGIETLPLPERLELLAQTADALAAAHSVGVLHKDLKPSNLLLHRSSKDGPLQLRLSDFGSARLIDKSGLSSLNIAQLGFTRTLVLDSSSGTPQYYAPELLAGQPPTIRSDVYALGVILYQLTVGDLRRALAPGWERGIDDPLLIEDIGAAAAGDPQHRLGDAVELAERLRSLPQRRETRERELAAAREAAATRLALERARARRGAFQLLAATLVVGIVAVTTLYLRAAAARNQAQAVTAFLTDDLLAGADAVTTGRQDVTVREVLDVAADKLDARFANDPRVQATLRRVIGAAYATIPLPDKAVPLLTAAERQLSELVGDADPETQAARIALSGMYSDLGEHEEQRRIDERILQIEIGAGRADSEIALGISTSSPLAACWSMYMSERVAPCVEIMDASYQRASAKLGPQHRVSLHALALAAAARSKIGRFAESLPMNQRAFEGLRRIYGDEHFRVLTIRMFILEALVETGHPQQALTMADQDIPIHERIHGREFRYALFCRILRARARLQMQQTDAALAELLDVRSIWQRSPTPSPRALSETELALADVHQALGQDDEAARSLAEGLSLLAHDRAEQPTGYWTLRLRDRLAEVESRRGRVAEAGRLLQQNWSEAQSVMHSGEWLLGWCGYRLGDFLHQQGQTDDARPLLTTAYPILRGALGEANPGTLKAQTALAEIAR